MHLHVPWALTCAVLQHEKDNSATAIKFTVLNPAIFSVQCVFSDVQSGNFVSNSIDNNNILSMVSQARTTILYTENCNDVQDHVTKYFHNYNNYNFLQAKRPYVRSYIVHVASWALH